MWVLADADNAAAQATYARAGGRESSRPVLLEWDFRGASGRPPCAVAFRGGSCLTEGGSEPRGRAPARRPQARTGCDRAVSGCEPRRRTPAPPRSRERPDRRSLLPLDAAVSAARHSARRDSTHSAGDSGISACRCVPPAAGLSSDSVPSSAATRSARPRRPEPRVTSAPPMPSSVTSTVTRPSAADRDRGLAWPGRTWRRWPAPRRRRSRRRSPPVPGRRSLGVGLARHRHGRAGGERLQRRLEAAVGEDGRVDAAGQLAQLGEARVELVDRLAEHGVEVVRAARARRRAELSRSLSATSRDCAPSCRSRSRRRRSASPASTIRAREARSSSRLARSSASSSERWVRSRPARKANGIRPGRDERRPPRRVADAGAGHRHEQEGQQREGVDRRELQAVDRRRRPPAPDRPREHDAEEHEVAEGAEAGEHRRQVVVAADQQQVGRAVVAAEVVRAGEEQRRHEGQREDEVAGDRERAVQPRWSAAPSGSSGRGAGRRRPTGRRRPARRCRRSGEFAAVRA